MFENKKNTENKKQENKENKEQKAKEVIRDRKNLFTSILERVLGTDIETLKKARENYSDVMVEVHKDPLISKGYDALKQIPVVGSLLTIGEAVGGVDVKKGEKINTTESLVKAGVSAAMMVADVVDIKAKNEGKEKPNNPFENLASKTLDYGIDSLKDKNPKLAGILGSVSGFLKKNEATVKYFENKVNEAVQKEKGGK